MLAFAFEEAARRGAPLTAVHTWTPNPIGDDIAAAEHEAGRLFDAALAGWPDKYPQVELTRQMIRSENPAEALAAASAGAGLLVVGSHTRGAIGGALLGSVTYRLVHTAHCPVAVVRGEQT